MTLCAQTVCCYMYGKSFDKKIELCHWKNDEFYPVNFVILLI